MTAGSPGKRMFGFLRNCPTIFQSDWTIFLPHRKWEFIFLFFILFFLCVFLGPHPRHMEGPRLGFKSEPQQCQIQAASATYTTAQGKAGSLTHWARLGIEPKTSWFLVGFVSVAPWREPQSLFFKTLFLRYSLSDSSQPSDEGSFPWHSGSSREMFHPF